MNTALNLQSGGSSLVGRFWLGVDDLEHSLRRDAILAGEVAESFPLCVSFAYTCVALAGGEYRITITLIIHHKEDKLLGKVHVSR